MSRIEANRPNGFEGIFIDKTTKRQVIDELMQATWNSLDRSGGSEEANALYDRIGSLEGISVVERRDCLKDGSNNYGCAQYVFGEVKKEPWCSNYIDGLPFDPWGRNTREVLESRGYVVVTEPQDGDIVAYGHRWITFGEAEAHILRILHFGIYRRGKVVSKFSRGHIFKHRIEVVPNAYGEEVIFFRKREAPLLHKEDK